MAQNSKRQTKNPILGAILDTPETLRDEFTRAIPQTALKQLGVLPPGKSFNESLYPQNTEWDQSEPQKPPVKLFRETVVFSADSRKREMEIEAKISQIRLQISSIAKEISVETTVTVEQEIQKPGEGHLSFFENMLSAFEKMIKKFKTLVQTFKTPKNKPSQKSSFRKNQLKAALSGSGERPTGNYGSAQTG